jgi:hypothetical protein
MIRCAVAVCDSRYRLRPAHTLALHPLVILPVMATRRCLPQVGLVVRFQDQEWAPLPEGILQQLDNLASFLVAHPEGMLQPTIPSQPVVHQRQRRTSPKLQHPVLRILQSQRTRTMKSSHVASGCQSSSTGQRDRILMQLHVRLSRHVSQDALGRRRWLLLQATDHR